jgi:hypothetical protein
MRTRFAVIMVLGSLLLSLVAGCVAGTTSFQKADVDQGKALVYVFRPESVFARGEMFKLEVNGTKQGMLLNNGYIPVHVDPGEVNVEVFKNSLISKPLLADLTLTAEAGGVYYVKVKPGVAWTVKMFKLDSEQGTEEISSAVLYQTK